MELDWGCFIHIICEPCFYRKNVLKRNQEIYPCSVNKYRYKKYINLDIITI
jgi:hypothetical protein